MEGSFDTKLHEAVRYGDIEEVKVSLQQGYDPNLIGLYQWSALHEAAHNGNKEILQLLLEKKGDPNKSDYLQQRTAMHYASEQGHVECLKMLLAKGGKYDIKDANGKSSLDVATPGGRKILEKLRVRDLMLMTPEEARQSVDGDSCNSSDTTSQQISDPSRRSSSDSLADKGPALGYIHLSFEYHSARSTMKVRAWQLTDLLLPPPNTSMIHAIYVKSYLLPDKKKETKRKTEEIKVESTESHIHWKKSKTASVQHVFTPSTFKFSKALEYSNITSDVIKEKHIQIEVCITQKYSHRSFLIGMLSMPLKSAVKRVVKEKIALIPCMNHSIPSNMKVYNAQDLNIMSNEASKVFFSNPNVRVMIPDSLDNESNRAASDPDLQPNSPSVEVDMSLQPQSPAVPVPKLDFSGMGLDESGYSSEVHISFPGELESPDSDGTGAVKQGSGKSVKVNVSTIDMGKKSKNNVKKAFDNVKGKLSPRSTTLFKLQKAEDSMSVTVEEDEDELKTVRSETARSETNTAVEEWKYQDIKQSSGKTAGSSDSRPSTPTWDYYDMPDEVVTFEPVAPANQWTQGAAPVLLPMATYMEAPEPKKSSSKESNKAATKLKGSKKKNKKALPGRAVPLIPEIIIVNADEEEGIKETSISIPEIGQKNTVEETEFDHAGYRGHKGTHRNVNTFETVADEGINTGKKEKKEKTTSKSKSKYKNKEKGTLVGSDDKKEDEGVDNQAFKKSGLFSGARRKFSKGTSSVSKSKDPKTKGGDFAFVVDIDEPSFNSGDSHVVELGDGVSISEISEGSQLFSHMTLTDQSLQASDVESFGIERRLPVNMSPKHYMIPMNVYTEDDTSCDESLSTDRSYIPTTEL